MVVLITCKNEEDTTKNEGTRVLQTLYIDFSDAQREAVSCMNGDDPIKNDGPRVLTTLYIEFSDAQGQLTQ